MQRPQWQPQAKGNKGKCFLARQWNDCQGDCQAAERQVVAAIWLRHMVPSGPRLLPTYPISAPLTKLASPILSNLPETCLSMTESKKETTSHLTNCSQSPAWNPNRKMHNVHCTYIDIILPTRLSAYECPKVSFLVGMRSKIRF